MSQKRASPQAGVEVAVVMFDLEVTEPDGSWAVGHIFASHATYSLFLSGWSSRSYRFWKLSRSPRAAVSATRCLDSLSRSITVPLEVTWPPPQTNSRVGGYDFLGGEAEVQSLEATLYFLNLSYTFLPFLDFLGWTI